MAHKMIISISEENKLILDKLQIVMQAKDYGEVIARGLGLLDWALDKYREGYEIGAYRLDGMVLKRVTVDLFPGLMLGSPKKTRRWWKPWQK